MPKLKITIPHGLTQDEAVRRVKNLLNDGKTRFADRIDDLQEEWDGNTGRFRFSAMGFAVSGTLTVEASKVEISGNLPFAAMLFKDRIETEIRDRAEKLLV